MLPLGSSFLPSCLNPSLSTWCTNCISNFHPPSALPVTWSTISECSPDARLTHLFTSPAASFSPSHAIIASSTQWCASASKIIISLLFLQFSCIFCKAPCFDWGLTSCGQMASILLKYLSFQVVNFLQKNDMLLSLSDISGLALFCALFTVHGVAL